MAFAFAFVPADQDVNTIPRPPTAAQLEELGAIDSGRGGHVRRRDLDHRRPDRHHDRRHRHHHGDVDSTRGHGDHAGRRLAAARRT